MMKEFSREFEILKLANLFFLISTYLINVTLPMRLFVEFRNRIRIMFKRTLLSTLYVRWTKSVPRNLVTTYQKSVISRHSPTEIASSKPPPSNFNSISSCFYHSITVDIIGSWPRTPQITFHRIIHKIQVAIKTCQSFQSSGTQIPPSFPSTVLQPIQACHIMESYHHHRGKLAMTVHNIYFIRPLIHSPLALA